MLYIFILFFNLFSLYIYCLCFFLLFFYTYCSDSVLYCIVLFCNHTCISQNKLHECTCPVCQLNLLMLSYTANSYTHFTFILGIRLNDRMSQQIWFGGLIHTFPPKLPNIFLHITEIKHLYWRAGGSVWHWIVVISMWETSTNKTLSTGSFPWSHSWFNESDWELVSLMSQTINIYWCPFTFLTFWLDEIQYPDSQFYFLSLQLSWSICKTW